MTTTFGDLYNAHAQARAERYAKARKYPDDGEFHDDRAIDLLRALAFGLPLAVFDRIFLRVRAQTSGHCRAMQVAPSAVRLLTAAARLLPAADRARYAEEYRSELWEIAHAGQPRRRQLRYASRQVVSSLHLRAELLAPRRKASP
jgi:hypothetical protein